MFFRRFCRFRGLFETKTYYVGCRYTINQIFFKSLFRHFMNNLSLDKGNRFYIRSKRRAPRPVRPWPYSISWRNFFWFTTYFKKVFPVSRSYYSFRPEFYDRVGFWRGLGTKITRPKRKRTQFTKRKRTQFIKRKRTHRNLKYFGNLFVGKHSLSTLKLSSFLNKLAASQVPAFSLVFKRSYFSRWLLSVGNFYRVFLLKSLKFLSKHSFRLLRATSTSISKTFSPLRGFPPTLFRVFLNFFMFFPASEKFIINSKRPMLLGHRNYSRKERELNSLSFFESNPSGLSSLPLFEAFLWVKTKIIMTLSLIRYLKGISRGYFLGGPKFSSTITNLLVIPGFSRLKASLLKSPKITTCLSSRNNVFRLIFFNFLSYNQGHKKLLTKDYFLINSFKNNLNRSFVRNSGFSPLLNLRFFFRITHTYKSFFLLRLLSESSLLGYRRSSRHSAWKKENSTFTSLSFTNWASQFIYSSCKALRFEFKYSWICLKLKSLLDYCSKRKRTQFLARLVIVRFGKLRSRLHFWRRARRCLSCKRAFASYFLTSVFRLFLTFKINSFCVNYRFRLFNALSFKKVLEPSCQILMEGFMRPGSLCKGFSAISLYSFFMERLAVASPSICWEFFTSWLSTYSRFKLVPFFKNLLKASSLKFLRVSGVISNYCKGYRVSCKIFLDFKAVCFSTASSRYKILPSSLTSGQNYFYKRSSLYSRNNRPFSKKNNRIEVGFVWKYHHRSFFRKKRVLFLYGKTKYRSKFSYKLKKGRISYDKNCNLPTHFMHNSLRLV